MFSPNGSEEAKALPWYCIQLLLDTIDELSPPSANRSKEKGNTQTQGSTEQLHRLHLMMISAVSSLSVPLMLRCLDHIRDLINAYPTLMSDSGVDEMTSKTRKLELLEALFSELLEKADEGQKEPAMRWWYSNRPTLVSETRLLRFEYRQEEGANEPQPVKQSRL